MQYRLPDYCNIYIAEYQVYNCVRSQKNPRTLSFFDNERGFNLYNDNYLKIRPISESKCLLQSSVGIIHRITLPLQAGRAIVLKNYSLTAVTTPEPTVRPPSRIAKRRPGSIAISLRSSTSISTLSPGMHISVPSGRAMTPVTSVVLK